MKTLQIVFAVALVAGSASLQAADRAGNTDAATNAETSVKAVENQPAFVNQLFQDLYGRGPYAAELETNLVALQQGTTSRAELAASLFQSVEFHENAAFLVKLYLSILKHDPQFEQWSQIVKVMRDGATQDDALSAFMNTPEYASAFPQSLSDGAMVSRLFQQMFDRAANGAELDSWASKMSQGTSRRTVMEALLRNPEFELHIGNRVNARLVYLAFLRRAGSTAEIARVAESFKSGASVVEVIGSILALPEFAARFQ
jgi:hypothetical protein